MGLRDADIPSEIQPRNLLGRSIDWDPAFREANHLFDRLVAASRLPDRASRRREYKAIEDELKSPSPGVLQEALMTKSERGAYVGKAVLRLLLPAVQTMQDASDRLEQMQNNLHIAFALGIFRAETGRYPTTLEQLAPNYLPSIPADRCSGKPLNYKPSVDGYVLYSVGVNGVDNGGHGVNDNPSGDDLLVRMPVPEPKEKK